MALQGSLDDFNIVNILQMIKLEGKTGRLALNEGDDIVKITFDKGDIIYAESAPQRDEARLGASLVWNSVIAPTVWEGVKKEHEDKLKPYWEILAKKLSSQELVEFIRRQVIDNVYYALRWKKGNYEFTPMKGLKYNDKLMTPLDVDALLMEGCRLADEWPRVTASLPPLTTFIVKNIIGEEEEDDSLGVKARESTEGGFRSSLEYEILNARGVKLSDAEVAVLSVIDKGKTINEIIDAARQGNFESLQAVWRLLQLGVIKPEKKKKEKVVAADKSALTYRLIVTVALLAIVAGGLYWQLTSWPRILEAQKSGMTEVKEIQARADLKKVEYGLKIYTTLRGKAPDNLDALVMDGILRQSDIIDPWNNRFQFNVKKNKFVLYSTGADAFLSKDNVYLQP